MIEVIAQCDCGCCYKDMHFNNVESANKAFEKVGFRNGATIIDDEGTIYTDIDTFYGFTLNEEEMERSPLQRLIDKIG